MTLPVAYVEWMPCWRIIPSRFPPIQLFERVTEPDDLEAIFELESLTNPRLRDEAGEIRLMPQKDRISGPARTSSWRLSPTSIPMGSRFTDGTCGVLRGQHPRHGHRSTSIWSGEDRVASPQQLMGTDFRDDCVIFQEGLSNHKLFGGFHE